MMGYYPIRILEIYKIKIPNLTILTLPSFNVLFCSDSWKRVGVKCSMFKKKCEIPL